MAFIDLEFPRDISYGSLGGPEYSTTIITTQGGQEQRNINWQFPRYRYSVQYGIRHERDVEDVLYFFHLANGRANSFRYFDWTDYKTSLYDAEPTMLDSVIGVNYGAQATHQLKKVYKVGNIEYSRAILLPIQGTVLMARNYSGTPVPLVEGTDFTINYSTGVVTILNVATNLGTLTWGGQFNVKVRFDSDVMAVKLDTYTAASTEISLIELR